MSIEPVLAPHHVVPLFTLPDRHGQVHNLARQRGREHWALLIFAPGVEPRPYLERLAGEIDSWRGMPARGIVVVPDAERAGALSGLPFNVLIDADERVRRRFLPAQARAGVFVLDRYGTLYHQWLVGTREELPAPGEISAWLDAISMQCSV